MRLMQRRRRRARRCSGDGRAAQASPGKDGTYLIRGGTVVTGTGEKLANTNILIRNGRIAQIGAERPAADAQGDRRDRASSSTPA